MGVMLTRVRISTRFSRTTERFPATSWVTLKVSRRADRPPMISQLVTSMLYLFFSAESLLNRSLSLSVKEETAEEVLDVFVVFFPEVWGAV